jgi:lycopene beta-cyclase
MTRLVIAGGGLSGCLAALALARLRPEIEVRLIERGERLGGNHIWSFFDTDVADAHRWLVEPAIGGRWRDHEIHFPKRSRRIAIGYNSLKSGLLDEAVRARLPRAAVMTGRRVAEIGPTHVLIEGGERIEADGVIDARGAAGFDGLDLAWQKFVGRTYQCPAPHERARPVIMDGRVVQDGGYRFVYTLPFSATELMIEDTYYSLSPKLDVPLLRRRLDDHAAAIGCAGTVTGEEAGVLPVALGGDVACLWAQGPPVARIGLRGGFFHPTTGYSLPDAVANALLIAGQSDLSGAALHRLLEARAQALWRERGFYRMLNRLLFRAAEPHLRYRVLEHFYRLPAPLIARFYAGRSTLFDKMRVVTGKPPVPFFRALSVMREQAA